MLVISSWSGNGGSKISKRETKNPVMLEMREREKALMADYLKLLHSVLNLENCTQPG